MTEPLYIESLDCRVCGKLLPPRLIWPANPNPCTCDEPYIAPEEGDPQAEIIKRLDRIIKLLERRFAS